MGQVSNTFETYDAVGNREELADKIYQITPEETPFVSLIGRKSYGSMHPEWQTATLGAVDLNNNQPEGNDWTYDAVSPTVRVGNYMQISDKRIVISRSQDAVNKAGRKSELAYELARKGVELKIDQEAILLSNQASSAGSGNGATNRKAGGMRAWLSTNDNMNSGTSGGFNSGTGIVDAAINGTQRAFDKSQLDATILSTYNAGGSPSVLMVSPYNKTVFSTFMSNTVGVAEQRYAAPKSGQTKIVAAADTYLSDFGEINVVPNRQMARAGAGVARNAFLIDPKMVHMGVFHPISIEKPGKTGDAEKRVLVTEYTLVVSNEAAHGVIADLYGLSTNS